MAQIFNLYNHYNPAAECSILLKSGTEFDNVTADMLQVFQVKEWKVKVIW